ncbi:hemolysin-III related-domain-containing protein [Podospora fimiseda]|uniref:Hemolysin-III related-domain-containing protein n=1 Tax=Podospora fimiseda TaxID=252190 RepID=A0AAN7BQ80_9PEZI|nr:hemolysin-III related-domain-containing protein [Podospora fimiseda]
MSNPPDNSGLRARRQPEPPKETLSSAAASTIKHILYHDLPPWRKDNAFILTGYRPTSNSFSQSFSSLLYLHNETVNIWSHLLGAIFFTLTSLTLYSLFHPRYETASSADILVFSSFFLGAFLCLGMSATYHAICNHSHEVARVGNKLDYTGIVFLIVGSYVPALWYGFFCKPALMTVYLACICLLGAGCIMVSWFEHFRTPAWRPYRALMFVGLGLSGVLPIFHALATLYTFKELNERMGLSWVILQGALYIFGAFLYAARWPERQFPRTFDLLGSSHQLFHILILFAAAAHLYGMIKAFDFHHSKFGSQC